MLQDAWARLRMPVDAWYWLTHHLQAGDAYQLFSLVEAFRDEYGSRHPIFIVTPTPEHAQIAALFEGSFAGVIIAPELAGSASGWAAFYRDTGLPLFGLNAPIVASPAHNPDTCTLVADGDRLQFETSTTYMLFYRHILHLPINSEPVSPGLILGSANVVQTLCRRHGVEPGRSVIFCPYSGRWPVEARAHFTALAAELHHRGLRLFTAVAWGEPTIPGSQAMQIPWSLLPEVAEYAGQVIAVRSAAAEVLSGARCRKTMIFSHPVHLSVWGVDALELGRDTRQLVFDFRRDGPKRFVDMVLSEASTPPFARTFRTPSDQLVAPNGAGAISTLSFTAFQTDPAHAEVILAQKCEALAEGGGALRLLDLPRRDQSRWAARVDQALQSLTKAFGDETRFYTCRDRRGVDFFEEVDSASLLRGRYFAARYWHSIIAVEVAPIVALLPLPLQSHVLALGKTETNTVVEFGKAYDTPSHRASLYLEHPLLIDGVQFIDGWEDVEPWGIWSRGQRSVIKFALSSRPSGPLVLTFGIRAAISDSFPALSFSVEVNGIFVADTQAVPGSTVLEVQIPFELARVSPVFWVVFNLKEVRSPAEQGLGADYRRIGLGLNSLNIATKLELSADHELETSQ